MSYSIISSKEGLEAESTQLKIFGLIGDLRTTLKESCHDKSQEVRTRLTGKEYTVRYVGVVWGVKGGDHVCVEAAPKEGGTPFCVDVTIGQFSELASVVKDPSSEGMVFIGPLDSWLDVLGQMFGEDFNKRRFVAGEYDMSLKRFEIKLENAYGELVPNEPPQRDILIDPMPTQVRSKVKVKRSGPCIIF